MSNLVKNTSIYAFGDILPRLLGFISLPILTNYLSTSDYGIVNYINTVNMFLMALSFMCLNTYYLVFYFRVGDIVEQKKLLGNLSIFIIGVNVVFSFLLFVFGSKLFGLFRGNIDFYPYIALAIITNFFNLFSILPSALFRVQERPLPLTILNVLKGILAFGLTLWLVVSFQFKALGVLYANLSVSVVFGILFLLITYKNMIWNINWQQIKKALLFSLPLLPGTISYYLVSMSDRILIDRYLTLSDLGIYGTASALALVLNIISSGAYKAFEPHFFKIYGTQEFLPQFMKIRNNYFFFILMGASGLALFAKDFFVLFTREQFHISFYYVPFILIGIVSTAMSMLYSTVITARGKTKISSAITVCGGVLSVALNVILLPRFGIIAACLTSGFTLSTMLLITVYYSKVNISHIRTLFAFVFAALSIYLSVYIFTVNSVVVSILCKVVIYMVMILIVSYILNISLKSLKF